MENKFCWSFAAFFGLFALSSGFCGAAFGDTYSHTIPSDTIYSGRTITFVNNTNETVWLGIIGGAVGGDVPSIDCTHDGFCQN